ncbi:MAG TPA: hypothetical protein DDW76_02905 [Cyanobacteria bacterium UBA11369]|nr:hypothetical protein [Cyanobacteria bacterium UBA11371]HBE36557.1 hypothetical protein [Cyanobacteria bacterium UBA11368]HBE47775.1 hypothetical protein [Cyanobacteria bacterium UBA11369]
MTNFNLINQSLVRRFLWLSRSITLIALINLILVFFDLSYIPGRDFYLQYTENKLKKQRRSSVTLRKAHTTARAKYRQHTHPSRGQSKICTSPTRQSKIYNPKSKIDRPDWIRLLLYPVNVPLKSSILPSDSLAWV